MGSHSLRLRRAVAVAVVALAAPPFVTAAVADLGVIGAFEGQPQIMRAAEVIAVMNGTALQVGDELRTSTDGRATVVFDDATVLILSKDTHIRFDQGAAGESPDSRRATVSVVQGNVRALIPKIYSQTGSEFQIVTRTAVATVHGTEFVVAFNPVADTTDVVGVEGNVVVQGREERVSRVVLLNPQEHTQVLGGKLPSPPKLLDQAMFRQYLDPFEFVGGGRMESVAMNGPVPAGKQVASEYRPQHGTRLASDRLPSREKIPFRQTDPVWPPSPYGDIDVPH